MDQTRKRFTEFGDLVREARVEAGMTVGELAAELDRAESTIRAIETGHQAGAAATIADDLCRIFPRYCEQFRTLRATYDIAPHARSVTRPRQRESTRVRTDATKLDGRWHALWQTRTLGEQTTLNEYVELAVRPRSFKFEMHRATADETRSGAGAWVARCRLTVENWVFGEFESVTDDVRIDGSFRLKLNRLNSMMEGMWLGISLDSEHTCGVLVMSRRLKDAEHRLNVLASSQASLPLILS